MLTLSIGAVLLVVLVLVLVGVLPTWPYSNTWGNAPAGIVGAVVVVLLFLVVLGII